jgi:hypothetical protein
MLFRPKTIDEASIQEQYLEGDKRKQQTSTQASRTTRAAKKEEKQEEVE